MAEKEEFGGGEVVLERFCGAEKHLYVFGGSVGRIVGSRGCGLWRNAVLLTAGVKSVLNLLNN